MTTSMTHAARAARRKQVADMVRRCGDVAAVCTHFGLSKMTVYDACREHGVSPPLFNGAGFYGHEKYQLLADLINTDTPLTQLAAKYGCGRMAVGRVYAACRVAGVPVKLRREGWPRGRARAAS